jgi:flavin reductase
MDTRELRACLGRFATGVAVVTCGAAGEAPHGATINSFVSVSLQPPLVLVSLARSTRACVLLRDRPFTVNVLAARQGDVALHFAGRPQPDLADPWEHVAPVARLRGCAAYIACAPWVSHPAGDHVLFLGRVTTVESGAASPLLFHEGRFWLRGPAQETLLLADGHAPSAGWAGEVPEFRDPVATGDGPTIRGRDA